MPVLEFFRERASLLRGLGWGVVAGAAIAGVLALSPYSLAYNRNSSIPKGLYLTHRIEPGALTLGDIGCFPYRAPAWAKDRNYFVEGMRLCKHVYAFPGTQVFRESDGLWVGNKAGDPVARYAAADGKGRPLLQTALATGVVPAGHLLMLAPAHKNSFDSRYLGYVPASEVTTQAWPIWTTASY